MPVEFNDISQNPETAHSGAGLTQLVIKARFAQNEKAANVFLIFSAVVCILATFLMIVLTQAETGPSQAEIDRANQLFIQSQTQN